MKNRGLLNLKLFATKCFKFGEDIVPIKPFWLSDLLSFQTERNILLCNTEVNVRI